MTEFYAPKARHECDNVEALSWSLVKDLYSNSTERWADPIGHQHTGKFAVLLPDDWRDIMTPEEVADIGSSIMTHSEMVAAGWFPVDDIV